MALSKAVQFHFTYHRLLGPDICITDTGPVLIEINAETDMVVLEMTYGPILLREEVLEEFEKYDILKKTNPQKQLFNSVISILTSR